MFHVDDDWGTPAAASAEAGAATDAETDAAIDHLLDRCSLMGVLPIPPTESRAATLDTSEGVAATQPCVEVIELGYVSPWLDEWGPPKPEAFPSKVGGLPVWLDPERLPPPDSLQCGECGKKLRFLLQIYCPRWPELPHAFHRSVMLFCCGGACLLSLKGWKALRCNMGEETPFYARGEDGLYYCPRYHVATEREAGLDQRAQKPDGLFNEGIVQPELWLSTYPEGDWKASLAWWESESSERQHVESLLLRYRQEQGEPESEIKENTSGDPESQLTPPSSSASDTLGEVGDDMEDGLYSFQRRVRANPEQVLRYWHSSSSSPLWMSSSGRVKSVPPCARCGAPRWFEFQVLPHLLASLHQNEHAAALEDLDDWGTVAVYSCSASCETPSGSSSAYAEEFVWHQHI
ncbi:hypothetical protein AB1Y20_015466 [Prymnesium parvum]|uniref:Programmed cell death protein 2 C-terminal domain-containing protein n=1 Tax=Prymnesium parvum TaxID=97485 RepID=A0AB34JXZ5_PRYPA